ncbi:MAG: PEGA domain-containing protein, partial [Victivallaceae bacterium]
MKTKLIASITVAALGISTMCGCSFFNKKSQLITISSQPEDAKIIINGTNYNSFSPQVIEVDNGEELFITLYREGYKTKYYVVSYHLSDTGKIDALCSILIFPMFGLCSDGAWQLDENNFSFTMDPLPPKEGEHSAQGESTPKLSGSTKSTDETPKTTTPPATPTDAATITPQKPENINATNIPANEQPALLKALTQTPATSSTKEDIDGDSAQANSAAENAVPAARPAPPRASTAPTPGENLPPGGTIDLKLPANTPEGQAIIISQ